MLDVAVEGRAGTLRVEASLRAEDGEVVAIVGPNGAGKSTLVRMIAGLHPLERGRITLGGETLAGDGVFVPPERRRIGLMFQSLFLFPHLDAASNVAFGLRERGTDARAARAEAAGWLERLGVGDAASLRPHALSGGQAQRVALARTLAPGPRALLLDEPLSALDAAARVAVRRDLRAHLEAFGGPAIVVTHDPIDALSLATRIAVMENGRIVQDAGAATLRSRPATRYVADLLGINVFHGLARGGTIEIDGGGVLVATGAVDGRVVATVHPHSVALYASPPGGSPRNVYEGAVIEVLDDGVRARVAIASTPPLVAEITSRAAAELSLMPGARVWVGVKATDVTAESDETE